MLTTSTLSHTDSADAQTVGNLPFNYSGRITEASGAPKDGPVEIVATFWTADIDGTQLGQPFDFPAVNLYQGVFALTFPFTAPQVQDIFRNGSETVFIEIATGDKKYPRQRFTFIPLRPKVRSTCWPSKIHWATGLGCLN